MLDQKLIEIIKSAMQGEEEAFVKLCEVKGRDILYFSIKLMGNRQDGEDAAQEILLQMQRKLGDLREPEAFQLWLYRIINSVCMNMRKKNKRGKIQQFYEDDEVSMREERKDFLPYDFAVDNEKRRQLLEIIDQLPYRSKMCVLLFYYQNMKYEEIGQILAISRKDVDNALYHSKKVIRKALERSEAKKKLLNTTYVLGSVPVLTHILQEDIAEMIPCTAVREMLAASPAIKFSSEMLAAGKAVDTVSAGSSSGSAGVGMSSAGKAVFSIVLTVGITVAGIAYMNRDSTDKMEQNSLSVPAEQAERVPGAMEEDTVTEEDSDINILEDMIGDGPASQLRELYRSGAGSYEEIRNFLKTQGLAVKESIYKLEAGEEFTLYMLEKKSKLLMVIVCRKEGGDACELTFRFTDAGDKVPRAAEIWKYYEKWKQGGEL